MKRVKPYARATSGLAQASLIGRLWGDFGGKSYWFDLCFKQAFVWHSEKPCGNLRCDFRTPL